MPSAAWWILCRISIGRFRQTLYANELGVAFEKGTHEALAARLQTVIDAMREDGTAEAIVEKYGFDAEKSLGGGN